MAGLSPQDQAWVNAAAKGTGLPPGVVAAQINMESGFNDRATSPVGAQGRAQFMPGTWKGLGIPGSPYDPNAALQGYVKYMGGLLHQFGGNVRNALAAYNAGPGNIQAGMGYANTILSHAGSSGGGGGGGANASAGAPTGAPYSPATISVPITTQTFDQAGYNADKAKYIAGMAIKQAGDQFDSVPGASKGFGSSLGQDNSALFQKGLLATSAPNPQNYVGTQTKNLTIATQQLQQLAGQPLVNAHAGAAGDVNPIPGAVIGRTDMGVDANLKPGSPILAPNDAKVVAVVPNWYSGQPYVAVQLTAGPNKGRVMYVAEQIQGVPQVGQTIRRGQAITRYASSGTGIEIGWASPGNPTQTLAQAQGNTGDASHNNAPAGVNFRAYLGGLHG